MNRNIECFSPILDLSVDRARFDIHFFDESLTRKTPPAAHASGVRESEQGIEPSVRPGCVGHSESVSSKQFMNWRCAFSQQLFFVQGDEFDQLIFGEGRQPSLVRTDDRFSQMLLAV